ncbi:putative GNAT family acetyltransferase [Xylariaceae sp. FL0804]|nr:putative GNAT family acetyltransferase [Xylariaceae sp. FL0804]
MAETPSGQQLGLHLRAATGRDAPRIAEIHMAAFGGNAMLRAQIPTAAARRGLRACVEAKARADIDDPGISVLVVVATTTGCDEDKSDAAAVIVAFAKWTHPVRPSGSDSAHVEAPWTWPAGTDLATLGAWAARAAEAERRSAVGDTPCYRLSFIGTDPAYGRRGAGRLLVQWGVRQADASGVPLYLESTVEAAPFYAANGFAAGETMVLPIRVVDDDGGEAAEAAEKTRVYEEVVFTYFPAR